MGQASDRVLLGTLISIAVLTAVLHILGATLLASSFWGVHVYAFFHPSVLIAATLFMLGLGILVLVRSNTVDDRLLGAAPSQANRRTGIVVGGAVLAGSALFWLARTRNAYLGDGNTLLDNIPRGELFHPREPLTAFLQQQVYRLTSPLFESDATTDATAVQSALAVGSVLAGALLIGVTWLLARELLALRRTSGNDEGLRWTTTILVWLILLSQGYVQLFFGYIENYTFYTLAVAIYLWLALRVLRSVSPLILPGIVLTVALALHLASAILMPSFLFLVVWALSNRQRRTAAIRDTIICLLFAVLLRQGLAMMEARYDIFSMLVETTRLAFGQKADSPADYLLTWVHLRDFLNEQLLVGPLGLLLFLPAATVALYKHSWRHAAGVFLFIAAGSYLVVSWIAGDSNLGYARNWDLFAVVGLVFTAAAFGLFFVSGEGLRRLSAALIFALLLSLYHTFPWVATNASSGRSLARLELLPLGLGRTEMLVGAWHDRRGQAKEAHRWYESAVRANPANANAQYLLSLSYARSGNADAAISCIGEAIKLRPDKLVFRQLIVNMLFFVGRFSESIPHIEFSLEQEPASANSWALYGDALKRSGRGEDAKNAFRKAVPLYENEWRQNPTDVQVNFGYGHALFSSDRYEEALKCFLRVLEGNPNHDAALSYVGFTLRQLGRNDEANVYFRKCLQVNPNHPDRAQIENWLRGADR
ncbi:MAG: tetratricopeptide repeat protein [bacterium]|nr:tetratricopeptide repeat protein [bacterium]